MRQEIFLIAALLAAPLAKAATIDGFTINAPKVPNKDPNLTVQQLWTYEEENKATMLKFVPGGEAVVTSHKTGQIRYYTSIDNDVDDYIMLFDLSAEVFSGGDHGLQSFAFHPDWEDGVYKLFALYTGETKNVADLPNNAGIVNMRPVGWGAGPPGTTGYSWFDVCPCLDCTGEGQNENGIICEHPYYIDRIAVNANTGVGTKELTLLNAACGSSVSHGPGHLLNVEKDFFFGVGDGSQYTVIDTGFQNDGCYEPQKGPGQGSLRSIRDDFELGKLRKIPYALLDSEVEITSEQLIPVGKGLRHPWRMHYKPELDSIFIVDVGFGDAGTSERIFHIENVSTQDGTAVKDMGWPCIEGVRNIVLGDYVINDGPFEDGFKEFVTNNNLDYCQATYDGAQQVVDTMGGPAVDSNFIAPIFEYRVGVLDEEYPDECTEQYAAISSVYYYEGENLPAEYADKLIFSDYSKQCVWYFENLANGQPDTSVLPKTLLSNTGFVDMTTGPDGSLYGMDFINGRVVRMSMRDPDMPTEPPTIAPTMAPTNVDVAALTTDAEQCFDPKDMPILPWTVNEDGEYESTLVVSAVNIETEFGPMRTFAYNGMMPGPVMRMKPCATYHLTLINDLEGWPNPDGEFNSMHSSSNTNLHLHGLHISGMSPGDDVFETILPGDEHIFTYNIPCDHGGGTNWYHPHYHGSSALQTNGGLNAFLIIEPSPRESSNTPAEIQKMPEQMLFIQDFAPKDLNTYKLNSKDLIFKADFEDPIPMINGCIELEMTVEAGQWTRLRMINSGITFNSYVTILPRDNAAFQCEIGLLAKDGVYLSEVPRAIPENKLFFSLASRNDIAIKCPTEGDVHQIMYSHIEDPFWTTPKLLGTITVAPSLRPAAEALPVWEPCRPAYLKDLTQLTAAEMDINFPLEVRDSINGQLLTAPDDYLSVMTLGLPQEWQVSGTNLHPLHVHVNHMQLGPNTGAANQWPDVDGWHMPGDWVDTLSLNGITFIRINPESFIGPMVLHCHVISHSDTGVAAVIDIQGDGIDATEIPVITDYGTCPEVIPLSTPYLGVAAVLPGLIEAENFDEGGEGIAYHNINYDSLMGPAYRYDTPVEIIAINDQYSIGLIRRYEWLKYSVDVTQAGSYSVSFNLSSEDPIEGLSISLWLDQAECPPLNQVEGLLMRVDAPNFTGTGSYDTFEDIMMPGSMPLTLGDHTLLLCFEVDGSMLLNSMDIQFCGLNAARCPDLTSPLLNL
mmetsp:Transcript_9325/g.14037  ORF Transcript_9325/g.14037 Transcript_9325/m.14037 type:complete len:1237 (-) Transcript_9325:165-3875(-)|eukprot:CAMPEP_0171459810 /NCGR_PEP_ID=MMETSP0945-20130129/4938_1 /TAXON_ID=109269 /ORGANISM="Vaucheria litorea, Strain CCMP2940" /LENGTH=1236 /DNA_ID=CAMNT_0011985889 /DNA_START=32 /DNA_END=3742 /DNA_ORIENTATION=+